jgi:hypothetical protein
MTKPKSKRHAKPSAEQLLSRLDRKLNALHAENVKQATSIALDLGALTVNVNELMRLGRKRDEQTDRLIGLMQTLVDRDRVLRQVADANRFMAAPTLAPWTIERYGSPSHQSGASALPEASGGVTTLNTP